MESNHVKQTKIESALLKSLANRETFETYNETLNTKTLFPATNVFLENYKIFFTVYEAHTDINFEMLYTQIATQRKDEDDILFYRDYFIPAIEAVSLEDANKSLLGLLALQTMNKINEIDTKGFDIESIQELLDDYKFNTQNITGEGEKNYITLCTADYEVLDKSKGIPYPRSLPSLQEALGNITLGQLIVLTADTNGGKSAMAVACAVEAFKHLTETKQTSPILYFNSEGAASDINARFFSNFLRDEYVGGYEEVLKDIPNVIKKFRECGYNDDLFKVFQMQGYDISYLKREVIKHNPALVVVDMCDELAPEESAMLLKKLYGGLRTIANNYCPVIGTSQAGDTSYWETQQDGSKKEVMKKWLTIKDVYGCRQKAGSADTLIGIGVEKDSTIRYISVPKKKRGTTVQLTVELEDIYSNFKEMF